MNKLESYLTKVFVLEDNNIHFIDCLRESATICYQNIFNL